MRPALTPPLVATCIRDTLAILGDDLPNDLRSDDAGPSLAFLAHAVEAVMTVDPTISAQHALTLVGLPGPDMPLAVASVMSFGPWRPFVVRLLADAFRRAAPIGTIRVVRPTAQVRRAVTATLMGDPPPSRSALTGRTAA